MPNLAKAYAINDAKILFVSLVDKAANKKNFLITKSEDGKADFQTFGRIIKADSAAHYVTGIVYEPMVEDSQGNYMTEEEITKAAYWFAKNGNKVDLQHSFQPLESASVVESYIAKCDEEINGEQIKKGTWLMTMEITDDDIFSAITKGDITGFSMGGTGVYSEDDVQLPESDEPVEKSKKGKGIMKQLASLFGFDVVEKGAVKDNYLQNSLRDNFWNAFYALNDYLLSSYNPTTGRWEAQTDESLIREALEDFSEIITGLLKGGQPITKALESEPVEKAGKAMSSTNVEKLRGVYESLGDFLSKFEEKEEEKEVTKADVEKIVAESIQKAMDAQNDAGAAKAPEGEGVSTDGVVKAARGGSEATEGITADTVQKMVDEAVQKAMNPAEPQLTMDDVQEVIEEAVAKAMNPVLKNAGLPTNLNDNDSVQKGAESEHYLHGIL